jgi:hypothetical protein
MSREMFQSVIKVLLDNLVSERSDEIHNTALVAWVRVLGITFGIAR